MPPCALQTKHKTRKKNHVIKGTFATILTHSNRTLQTDFRSSVQLQNLNWTQDKSTIFCPNTAMKKHQRMSPVHWRESEKEKRTRVYLSWSHQNNKFGVITEISVYPVLSMRLPFF
jgi:hypothetical protein